ncbi:Hyaluronan/mRNA-binding protein [Cryptosporidium felis]|nr:Hyaluronan/mRNA-binding protein [Cryptosporidium felis]
MRTVYTVNTRNKFAALSLSDDEDDQQVPAGQQADTKVTTSKENPPSLIYPKTETSLINSASVADTNIKLERGSRKGNTVHRGGRGGYSNIHGRVFDRRDASGKAHRVSKVQESPEIGREDSGIENGSKSHTLDESLNKQLGEENENTDSVQPEAAGLEDDRDKDSEKEIISYEEYMKAMASKRLEVPTVPTVKGNTTAKDFEKEGLQRYVRDETPISTRNSKNKPNKTVTKSEKGVFNYFELVEKYTNKSSFGRRGNEFRRRENKEQQRLSNKLQVKREAPDVSDTRVFPALGN